MTSAKHPLSPHAAATGVAAGPADNTPRNRHRIASSDIRALARGRGTCVATDRITVDGELVGYMYRAEPGGDGESGWHFMAGDESDAYMDDAGNHGVFDVNTIANYDPQIIAVLDAPPGTAFERVSLKDGFRQVAAALHDDE